MHYHAILLTGKNDDHGGRSITGHRLRTAAQRAGFQTLVIDSAAHISRENLESILANVITSETLVLGISAQWINRPDKNTTAWMSEDFLKWFKAKYPTVSIVAGGLGSFRMPGSRTAHNFSDWNITGYSDDSFPRLLKKLRGDTDHGLKYMIEDGVKRVYSDQFHQIANPDDIETVFELDDGFLPYQPVPLEVSRGCIFHCSYCNHPFQGAKDYDAYMRTPDSLARELKRNYELFGTTRYTIMDDTFNDSIEKLDRLERAVELAKLPDFEFVSYIRAEILATKPTMHKQLARMGFKGGLVGIESLNKTARKAIGRGMDIDRVMDSIRELKAESADIKMSASNIIGLPGDTPNDIAKFNKFYEDNRDTLFAFWEFHTLGIQHPSNYMSYDLLSDIEKDPAAFGYTLMPEDSTLSIKWTNQHMNNVTAKMLNDMLFDQRISKARVGGWLLATAWHINTTKHDIDNTTLKHLNLSNKSTQTVIDRANDFVKKFT